VLIPYIRQSRKKEQTISLDDQRASITKWAEGAGVELAPEVVEQGVSGSKHWKKRELGRAVEACQRGEADGIVVAFQDRLSRESGLGTAEVWEALDMAGARLVATSEGLDTSTGDHEMLFTIKAAIAREQWKRHRLNWANAKHASWERGEYVAAAPPGYDHAGGLVPNEAAEVVRQAFELRAAAAPAKWAEVWTLFEAAGIKTKFGGTEWSPGALRGVIANETYTGKHSCTCGCGESVVRPEWEIVPGWLWRKAQVDAGTKPETVSRGEGHALGQGLVRCEVCGKGLERSNGTLRCPSRGEGHAAIRYDRAVDWVLLEVGRYVGAARVDDGLDVERAEAEQRVADCRAALAEAEAFVGGRAPRQEAALAEAEDRLAAIGRPDGFDLGRVLTPLGVKEHVESLPVPEQRRAIRSLVSRVVLLKSKGTDEEREQVKAGSRHPAQSRLRIEFADGSVSPAEHDWAAIAAQINEGLAA
jgi:DNA invertase Pin-like site-specific DNA recombinase